MTTLNIQILKFDLDGVGLSQEVLWSTTVSGLPVGGVLIMLALDTLLYGLLAAWLDNILPTEYGTRRPPWFCLLPSFWRTARPLPEGPVVALPECEDREPGPQELQGQEAVRIRNLRKVFSAVGGEKVTAVADVSLDVSKTFFF